MRREEAGAPRERAEGVPLKPDYGAHDARYQQLKAEGVDGWDPTPARERGLTWALGGLQAGTRVLELGCGAGNAARWFVDRGCAFTGVDVSPTAVAWAEERGVAGARFVVGDITRAIPGTYDLVVDGHCLHCIIGGDRARVLANVRGALSPHGRFFVSTMCGAVTMPELIACFDPVTRCQVVGGIARRFIGDPEQILGELRAAGFEVLRWVVDPRTGVDDQDHLWAMCAAGPPVLSK